MARARNELEGSWTGAGQELESWTRAVKELDRTGLTGPGEERDRNWKRARQELEGSWTGAGRESDRSWTGASQEVKGCLADS